MVTKTYKNKVQVAGIENWALHVYPVSHFYFVFYTDSVHFRSFCNCFTVSGMKQA